jgi:HlyD family secretion protein
MAESSPSLEVMTMRNRIIFWLSGIGLLLGIGGAVYFGISHPPQPPAFDPAANPYSQGLYANGIIESAQPSGSNINLNPEVSGTVTRVLVAEGQSVEANAPLYELDTSIAQATADQLESQASAADATLAALRAEPRPEVLSVSKAQLGAARAGLRLAIDQRDKLSKARSIDPRSVSPDQWDNAENAVRIAAAAADVAERQVQLTAAGAWHFDIESQARTAQALHQQALAARALLHKYTVRAPVAGRVLALGITPGASVSPQGTYDTYTRSSTPAAVLSAATGALGVRVYVDEILVSRLPPSESIQAQMQIRGTTVKVPLRFDHLQPYVTPKIELSDQRAERVDLRVLPMLFRFETPPGVTIYPGQLVDVYIGSR